MFLGLLILAQLVSYGWCQTTISATAQTGHIFSGKPAIYGGENFNITIKVQVAELQHYTPVTMALILPHMTTSSLDCKYWQNGTAYDCNNVLKYTVFATFKNSEISYDIGSKLIPKFPGKLPQANLQASLHILHVDLGEYRSHIDGQPQGLNDTITMKIPAEIMQGYHNIGSDYKFTAKAHVNISEEYEKNVTVRVIGPDVRLAFSTSPAGNVEAGDVVDYSLTVDHDSATTTENAVGLKLNGISNSTEALIVSGSASYRLSSAGSDVAITDDDLLAGVSLPNLNTAASITIKFKRTLTDKVKLGRKLGVWVGLTYQNPNARQFSRYGSSSLSTKRVVFDAHPNDIYIDGNFLVGRTITIQKGFRMPLGTINNLQMWAEITYSAGPGATIPVNFTKENLSTPTYVKKFQTSVFGRKRRASTQTVVKSFNSLTNPASGGISGANVTVMNKFQITNAAVAGATLSVDVSYVYNAFRNYVPSSSGLIKKARLNINKTVEMVDNTVVPNVVRFNVTVEHLPVSNYDAYNTIVQEGSTHFGIYFLGMTPPHRSTPGFSAISNYQVQWKKDPLTLGSKLFISYSAQPRDKGVHIPDGTKAFYNASLTYKYSNASGAPGETLLAPVCFQRLNVEISSLFYQHGLTVLTFVCALILAVLLVILCVFIYMKLRNRSPHAMVRPSSAVDELKSQGLITNHRSAMRKGVSTIKDFSKVAQEDSIVFILSMKDKLNMYKELNSLDVLSTINVDTDIEDERDNAMILATILLIQSLRKNGDITKQVEEKSIAKFNNKMKDLEKRLDGEFRKQLEKIYKMLSRKNKDKLGDLVVRQEAELDGLEQKMLMTPEKEKNELLDLMRKQHELEKSDMTYGLKLEQDEETEKLRKEFAIRKRMGIKEGQQEMLDEVKTNGNLKPEQIQWLMNEYYKNQANIEQIYDDEISRQRMVLEEKLARRRAMADTQENEENCRTEELNTVAEQQMSAIKKAKKNGLLSGAEMEEMMEKLEEDLMAAKNHYDAERAKQEAALHKELSERKRQRLAERTKKHGQDLAQLEKKQQTNMADNAVDPLTLIQSKQTMLSHQRSEMFALENEIDEQNARELERLRDSLTEQTKVTINEDKEKLFKELRDRGMSDEEVEALMQKHKKDVEKLRAAQEEDRQHQEEVLKRNLAKRRKNWAQRMEEEKQEQQNLREHEDRIVRKLMGDQVAMSEQERDRIMQEHEKQMVTLENSLTLNKLHQRRMLEEKLAQRKARQMEDKQKEQLAQLKKQSRQTRDADSEEEEELQQKELKMMKKHAEQRIAILQGEKIKIEEEMEEIRVEMMKERADALKEQEVRLGAMIAALQMEKAKEMARIEEQQRAINNLKTNLMDDLNDRGVLSDPECQKVIQIHQKEQEKLNRTLEDQRNRQEEKLRRRLQDRLKHREKSIVRMQKEELDHSAGDSASKAAFTIKRMALMHKHMLQYEQFKNRMDKEISQTLEELRRQQEINRIQALQQQEIQFLNGLVRLGKFQKKELSSVIQMLYPTKTEQERQAILNQLCEGYEFKDEKEEEGSPKSMMKRRPSTLEARIKSATYDRISNRPVSSVSKGRQKKSAKGKKKKLPPTVYENQGYDDSYEDYRYGSYRPDPVGRSQSPTYNSDRERYTHMPPAKLPPMDLKKAKKKKRQVDFDDDY